MNKKRLLKLADFLESVPPRKFNLSTWVQSMPTQAEGDAEGSCGFAGCAVGWAVHAKLFRGLSFGEAEIDDEANRPPKYRGFYGFTAIEILFDIEFDEGCHLFDDAAYPNHKATPKQVAKRIRAFASRDGVIS